MKDSRTTREADLGYIISMHYNIEYIADGIVKGSGRHTNGYIEEYM